MDLTKILNAVVSIGSDLPAFKQIFDEVVQTFEPTDQATLQQAYADAMVAADKAHAAAQAI